MLVGITVLGGLCAAQEQQWLQYRSAREVSLLGSGSPLLTLELSTIPPNDVKLPQFKQANPFFAKWQTPMVKAGFLWIAMDRSTKAGPYNLLYIDSNGDGNLDDETPTTAYQLEQSSASFGPVKVVFQAEDGPVAYHLNFRYYSFGNDSDRRLYVSSGGWYEGDITIGGAKKHCLLFDYNTNGTFDDKSPNADACDRIVIGNKIGQDAGLVGRYLESDGVLYEAQIAHDGAFIKLSKAENIKLGHVRLPDSLTSCSVGGENGSFAIKPQAGIGSLPVGAYRVLSWTAERTDDSGAKWQVTGQNAAQGSVFEVAEDKEAVLDAGEPIVATLQATNQSGTYSFRLTTVGKSGEQIDLLRNGARPQAPGLRIKNQDGTYDRTFNFEYG